MKLFPEIYLNVCHCIKIIFCYNIVIDTDKIYKCMENVLKFQNKIDFHHFNILYNCLFLVHLLGKKALK